MLTVLAQAPPKMRKAILTHANEPLVRTLTECVYNVLRGNVPVKACDFKKLKRFRSKLRKVVAPKQKWRGKRDVFIQHGGFLPILLPIIGSAISGLITHFMTK